MSDLNGAHHSYAHERSDRPSGRELFTRRDSSQSPARHRSSDRHAPARQQAHGHAHHNPHHQPQPQRRRSRSRSYSRSPPRAMDNHRRRHSRSRSRSRSPSRDRHRHDQRHHYNHSSSRNHSHGRGDRRDSRRTPSSSRSRSRSESRSRSRTRSSSHSRSSSRSGDGGRTGDSEGHLQVVLGANLTARYKILAELGEGTFGRVLECWDRHTKRRVAVKVVRALDRYTAAARIEVDVLRTLQRHDPAGTHGCVQLLDEFDFQHHVCMVFELLGPSLYDELQRNAYRPFPPRHVQAFTRQLLRALAFVHRHSLVHTDLKPENLLLATRDPACTDLRLIDFGSATFEHAHHTAVVGTRHYRAPEVILGLGWSYPCDMWSVGCIVLELYTGEAVFQTHDNAEHLAMMQRLLGPMPPSLVARATPAARTLFAADSRLRLPERPSRHLQAVRTLSELLAPQHANLLALLRELLQYDPARRISARDALLHPYLRDVL